MDMNIQAPGPGRKRVVIVGGGFAGIALAEKLCKASAFQTVLVDQDNYHEFQPLLYQVATAGLEPTAIAFPFRSVFRRKHDFHFRMAKVQEIIPGANYIRTSAGDLHYDYLVLAAGTDTNYFGMKQLEQHTMGLKSVPEALALRNRILATMEHAIRIDDPAERVPYLNFVIVGGGPTGVELAGALAELRNRIFPKDYPDLDIAPMKIYLINGGARLLETFSEKSSARALKDLRKYGVEVLLDAHVTDYDGETVSYGDGNTLATRTVIWASGVTANTIAGIDASKLGHANRIVVDEINRIPGMDNIFVLGDQALQMTDPEWPKGHPQLAQPAIQQGRHLAVNLNHIAKGEATEPFRYKDKGSLATIGRNQAVAEIGKSKFGGFFAWVLWLCVHLFYIIGVRNRMAVLFGWMWDYLTYDHPLRTIITPAPPKKVALTAGKNGKTPAAGQDQASEHLPSVSQNPDKAFSGIRSESPSSEASVRQDSLLPEAEPELLLPAEPEYERLTAGEQKPELLLPEQ